MFFVGFFVGLLFGFSLCALVSASKFKKGVNDMEWISVKDKLPEENQNCIIWTGSAFMSAFYLGNDKWWLDYYDRTQTVTSDWFTHWMPLPEPPKED